VLFRSARLLVGAADLLGAPQAAGDDQRDRVAVSLGEALERDGNTVPLIVSGGLRSAEQVRRAYEESDADAVMIARGSLGNPWIFEELATGTEVVPTPAEIEAELRWILDRAAEHWGEERAARNLRKFYPWYVERLGYEGADADRFQRTNSLDEVRELLSEGPSTRVDAGISSRLSTSL